jgi:hypothetical protein
MTRSFTAALIAAAGLWALSAGSASASVDVAKLIAVKDVAPAESPGPTAPAAERAKSAAHTPPRSRPGPRVGGVAAAAMAPAQLGAKVADFMARTITNGVAGDQPAAADKPRDPA